jgi:hypothetical protein
MIRARLQDATLADLEALVGVAEEGVTLDFKRDLPGDDRDSRKEFIADVCALANTKGGDLIYGIDEDAAGRAGALVPHAFNPDAVITALSNVLADNLEPRLHGVAMRAFEVGARGNVLVIRVPRTFSGIHRSLRDGHFWIRESRSKRHLDISGITNRMREMFGREDLVADFFAKRYAAVLGETYPVSLDPGVKVMMHILPSRDFLSGEERDLSAFSQPGSMYVPPNTRSSECSATFEGMLHLSNFRNGASRAASQIFRSGVVEGVCSLGILPPEHQFFALESIEDACVAYLQSVLPLATQHLTGGWPVTVRISLLGIQGLRGLPRDRNLRIQLDVDERPPVRVHSPVLSLPDLLIEQTPVSYPAVLRGTFDRLWQAWGFPRSFSLEDRDGAVVWRGQP